MSSVTDSISSLFTSIFNIFRSIIETFFHSIQAVFATAQNLVSSVINMAGGLVQFVLSMFLPPFPLSSQKKKKHFVSLDTNGGVMYRQHRHHRHPHRGLCRLYGVRAEEAAGQYLEEEVMSGYEAARSR